MLKYQKNNLKTLNHEILAALPEIHQNTKLRKINIAFVISTLWYGTPCTVYTVYLLHTYLVVPKQQKVENPPFPFKKFQALLGNFRHFPLLSSTKRKQQQSKNKVAKELKKPTFSKGNLEPSSSLCGIWASGRTFAVQWPYLKFNLLL